MQHLFLALIQLTSFVPFLHHFASKTNQPKFKSKTLIHALVRFIITYSKASPNPFFLFHFGLQQNPTPQLHLTTTQFNFHWYPLPHIL